MSSTKALYEQMIDAGIPQTDAREFLMDQLNDDPVKLEQVIARVMVEVEVTLDASELSHIDHTDDMAIEDIAYDAVYNELMGSTYGCIECEITHDIEIFSKTLDNGDEV